MTIATRVVIREIVEADVAGFLEWHAPDREESLRRSLQRHEAGEVVYLVAELDSEPVAHLGVDLVRVRDAALLWQFGVIEHLRSQGIGTAMVGRAEETALSKGFETAEIAAETTNPRARALYERLGYRLCDEVDGEWILRKSLVGERA